MRRLMMTLLASTFLVGGPLAAQEQAESMFIRVEYWTCPQENMEALAQTADSVFAPILDELVSEGAFVRWGRAKAIRAFPIKRGDEGEPKWGEPKWDWVFSFTATSEEAFHSAWEELFARLGAKFPVVPDPWRFCDEVVWVDYLAPAPR